MYTSAKEASVQVRQVMKELGLKVNVRIAPGSSREIQVYTKTFEDKFTEEQKLLIMNKAHEMGFTGVRGMSLAEMKTNDANQINLHF
jgi:hypothetical protein